MIRFDVSRSPIRECVPIVMLRVQGLSWTLGGPGRRGRGVGGDRPCQWKCCCLHRGVRGWARGGGNGGCLGKPWEHWGWGDALLEEPEHTFDLDLAPSEKLGEAVQVPRAWTRERPLHLRGAAPAGAGSQGDGKPQLLLASCCFLSVHRPSPPTPSVPLSPLVAVL